MKLLPGIIAAGLLLSSAAYAIQYHDSDGINAFLSSDNPSYSNTFNIVNDGYNPATQQVLVASVTFNFWDGDFQKEALTIDLGSTDFASHGSFFWDVSIGGGLSGTALFDLSADGILSYTITATKGDFWVESACLTATAGARSSVPDGGSTVALTGCGLLLLGLFSRRFGFRRG